MIIIDPVVVIVGARDSHKNAETRRGLQPLIDLCMNRKIAGIGITHFTKGTQGKNPNERVTASLAFAAVARIVIVTATMREADADPPKVMLRAAINIGRPGGGYGYSISCSPLYENPEIEATSIKWKSPIEGNAQEILDKAEGTGPNQREVAQAVRDWLKAFLSKGPRLYKDITTAAKNIGYSEDQLTRAKKKLNVVTSGVREKTEWELGVPEF